MCAASIENMYCYAEDLQHNTCSVLYKHSAHITGVFLFVIIACIFLAWHKSQISFRRGVYYPPMYVVAEIYLEVATNTKDIQVNSFAVFL